MQPIITYLPFQIQNLVCHFWVCRRNESLERFSVFVAFSFSLFSIPLPAESIKITLCHQSHSWGYLPPHPGNQLPQGSTSCHPVRPHKTTPWISLITLPPLPCYPRFHSPAYCSPVVCGDVDKTPSFFRSGMTISLVQRNGITQKPHRFTPHILRSSAHYLSPIHIVSSVNTDRKIDLKIFYTHPRKSSSWHPF